MLACKLCEGELIRHGITKYKKLDCIGIRYICIECGKTFTYRTEHDKQDGVLFFNATGRPTKKDARYA